MTEPLRIKCNSPRNIPDINEIKKLANKDHHVVLHFKRHWFQRLDKVSIVTDLSECLPDYSIFDSGGDKKAEWITITLVVNRHHVLDQSADIWKSINSYIDSCKNLLSLYEMDMLSADWDSWVHGNHCCFENTATGQIVEAPLSGAPRPSEVDPYFYAIYTKTSNEFPSVINLIEDDFHDAARILEIILEKKEKAQQKKSAGAKSRTAD